MDTNDAAAQRRRAFVDAAREAFFANGYAGTTMSSISGTAGGSKTTLWNYFPSKEALFLAVVEDIVSRFGDAFTVDLPTDAPVPEVLRSFGLVLMRILISPPLLSLYRLVVGEAERFPHLAECFYDRGPRRGKARLAEWIKAKMALGELRSGDPALAVAHYSGLCQSGLYAHAVLGMPEGRALERIEPEVEAAVDSFCRAWAPRRAD